MIGSYKVPTYIVYCIIICIFGYLLVPVVNKIKKEVDKKTPPTINYTNPFLLSIQRVLLQGSRVMWQPDVRNKPGDAGSALGVEVGGNLALAQACKIPEY